MKRQDLESEWFKLTREIMPAMAAERDWPVRFDHCFQRILLDNAVGAKWRDVITPPAYRNAPDEVLRDAIALGRSAISGAVDLHELNRNSLRWRQKLLPVSTRGSSALLHSGKHSGGGDKRCEKS